MTFRGWLWLLSLRLSMWLGRRKSHSIEYNQRAKQHIECSRGYHVRILKRCPYHKMCWKCKHCGHIEVP